MIDARRLPCSWRWRMASQTASTSKGCSGMSVIVAPPAMPAQVAMWPAWRPITSTTITRSWLSAVVCRRSMASTQIWTAVSKPNVSSVADRSLSMVLGTPTTGTPSAARRLATPRVSSPPMATRASMPSSAERGPGPLRAAVDLVRVGARRPQDRAAPGQRAPEGLHVEGHGAALEHALPAVEEADELVAVDALALAGDGPHDRVEAWAVAPAGEHRDAHATSSCLVRLAAGRYRPAVSTGAGNVRPA